MWFMFCYGGCLVEFGVGPWNLVVIERVRLLILDGCVYGLYRSLVHLLIVNDFIDYDSRTFHVTLSRFFADMINFLFLPSVGVFCDFLVKIVAVKIC
jgi:hypothetical protein